jgi:hypothetical protein
MKHELNIIELNTVSGGLQRNPFMDAINQQLAAQNNDSNTFGGSLTGNLVGGATAWGCAATGGHPV